MRPKHIVLFVFSCLVLLGGVCVLFPQQSTLFRWPTLGEVFGKPSEVADTLVLADTLETIAIQMSFDSLRLDTIVPNHVPDYSYEPDTVFPQAALAAFYRALRCADTSVVRVVHYGDSQIEEDRMSSSLRRYLQREYGGGGVGLIPLHQTIPTLTLSQRLYMNDVMQTTQQGPKRYMVYGPRSLRRTTNQYGMMGQVAVMNDSLVAGSEDLILKLEPMSSKVATDTYFSRIRVFADTTIHYTTSQLEDSTSSAEIHLSGRGDVYGISLETSMGVMLDNIPMRGCNGNVFTQMDSMQLATYFSETHTALIILQFGGNSIPSAKDESYIRSAVYALRLQVRFLRSCAPNASILFIGPSDMLTSIDGELQTYPLIPYMDHLLSQMARSENIAYFSLYNAMGGRNSMISWQQKGWAGSDGVHFSRCGAEKATEKLIKWMFPN